MTGFVYTLRHNVYAEKAMEYLFPGRCAEHMLVHFDFLHAECAPILLSRLLGIFITLGSTFLFVPQILKIYNAKSGAGISLAALFLGLISSSVASAYSYERQFVFGQWGDSLFVAIQTMAIIMQILYFSDNSALAFAFASCCWSTSMAVLYHYVPMSVLAFIQAFTLPIVFLSKGIQLVANYRQRGTGQLSVISVAMQFVGCAARVFTSIQETSGDWLVIAPYVLSSLLNGIILAQIIYYGADKAKKQDKKKKQ